MSTEIIALIMTTIGGITAAVKAIAEARKARYESAARIAEAARSGEDEKTADAIIQGVEKVQQTVEGDMAKYVKDTIKDVALAEGVEEKLNKRVKNIKKGT